MGHTVDVYVLDTAGQEEFLPLRSRWINDKDAFIIAASVEDLKPEEFEKFNQWIKTYHHDPDVVPIAGFITKIDIEKPHHKQAINKMQDYCAKNSWNFEKTSAKMNINVQESFERLIKKTLEVKYSVHDYEITDGIYKSCFGYENQIQDIESPSPVKFQRNAEGNGDEKFFPEDIYESQVFINDIDSYKDKSKRKLIDLSFSNRSDDSKDYESDTGLENASLNSEDMDLMTDSLRQTAQHKRRKENSIYNSNEETPEKNGKTKNWTFNPKQGDRKLQSIDSEKNMESEGESQLGPNGEKIIKARKKKKGLGAKLGFLLKKMCCMNIEDE